MSPSGAVALRWSPRSAREARVLITDVLTEMSAPPVRIADAALVVSELVGNALRHARPTASGDLQFAWSVDELKIQLEVTDGGGDTRPEVQPQNRESVGGRGLAMVAAVSSDWGARAGDGTCTVWVVLPFRAESAPGPASYGRMAAG